jgi:hypothetical protein
LNSVFKHQILPLSKNAIQKNKDIKKLLEEQSAQQKELFKLAINTEPVTVFDKLSSTNQGRNYFQLLLKKFVLCRIFSSQ